MNQEDSRIDLARRFLRYAQYIHYIRPYKAGVEPVKIPKKHEKKIGNWISIFTTSSNLADGLSLVINEIPDFLEKIKNIVGDDIFTYAFVGPAEKIGPLRNEQIHLLINNDRMEEYLGHTKNKIDEPSCFIKKDGIGYLLIGIDRIRIGKPTGQQYRLLRCLCDPFFGVTKTNENILNAMGRNAESLSQKQRRAIIENTFGEIQEKLRADGLPDIIRLKTNTSNQSRLVLTNALKG